MIEAYMNQSITLKTKTATNEYGDDTYTESTVKGRFEYKRRSVMSKDGEIIIASAMVYLTTAIQPDDMLSFGGVDFYVVAISSVADLFGSISHYEVVVT